MTILTEIQAAILTLDPTASRLRAWFIERDHAAWDAQITRDDTAGRLDFLIAEAMAEKAAGTLHALPGFAAGRS